MKLGVFEFCKAGQILLIRLNATLSGNSHLRESCHLSERRYSHTVRFTHKTCQRYVNGSSVMIASDSQEITLCFNLSRQLKPLLDLDGNAGGDRQTLESHVATPFVFSPLVFLRYYQISLVAKISNSNFDRRHRPWLQKAQHVLPPCSQNNSFYFRIPLCTTVTIHPDGLTGSKLMSHWSHPQLLPAKAAHSSWGNRTPVHLPNAPAQAHKLRVNTISYFYQAFFCKYKLNEEMPNLNEESIGNAKIICTSELSDGNQIPRHCFQQLQWFYNVLHDLKFGRTSHRDGKFWPIRSQVSFRFGITCKHTTGNPQK